MDNIVVLDFNHINSNIKAIDTMTEDLNTKLHDILEEKGICTVRELFGFGSPDIGWAKEDINEQSNG